MVTDFLRKNAVTVTAFVATLAGFALGCAFERAMAKTGDCDEGYMEYENEYDPDILEDEGYLTTRKEEPVEVEPESGKAFEKPALMAYWEGEPEDAVESVTESARIISQEEYMELDPGCMNVATYFVEDEILAGINAKLDELDPAEVFGGVPQEAVDLLKEGSTSGVYVLCGDGENGLEIVASHGNFLEEHEAADAAFAEEIAVKAGYSGGARPSGRSRG